MTFDRFPVITFWETTQACELKCLHCRASSIWERNPNELNTKEAKKLLEELASFERKPVVVFTGGNPLIRDDIYELISHAKDLGLIPALAPTVSNRINEETVRAIKNAGVKYVSISLDGSSPKVHDFIRGESGHFYKTLDAISLFQRSGIQVQINTTVMSVNKEDVGEIFKLIKKIGVDTWEVFFVVPIGRAYVNLDLTPQEYEAVCNFLYDASYYGLTIRTVECPFIRRILLERIKGINRAKDSSLYNYLNSSLEGLKPTGQTTLKEFGTLDGDGVLFIGYDGTIYPSGLLNVPLGNVRKDSLVKIYKENELLNKFRKRELKGKCGSCEYRFNCGGSRSRAYFYFRDPLAQDPACVLTL